MCKCSSGHGRWDISSRTWLTAARRAGGRGRRPKEGPSSVPGAPRGACTPRPHATGADGRGRRLCRVLRLPHTIGLTVTGAIASLGLVAVEALYPSLGLGGAVRGLLTKLEFQDVLMEGVVSFLQEIQVWGGGLSSGFF